MRIATAEAEDPRVRQRTIADFARARLREAEQQNKAVLGQTPPHKRFVDGREGAPLESVRPERGTIVFEFELIEDVLAWILRTLQERSPVVTGAYASSHLLFADGQEIVLGDRIPIAEEYSFTNPVPYSRKIEIGKTESGRDFVIQVQNRIYERTAKDARSRFGNLAKITFTYRGIVGGYKLRRGQKGNRRRDRMAGADVRFPTIVVRPN